MEQPQAPSHPRLAGRGQPKGMAEAYRKRYGFDIDGSYDSTESWVPNLDKLKTLCYNACMGDKSKIKKAKRERLAENVNTNKKGMNVAGKKGRIPDTPPGTPSGKHHEPSAKIGQCFCGRCSNAKIQANVV